MTRERTQARDVLVEVLTTEQLSTDILAELRDLLLGAFAGDFDDNDWDHALGGRHVLVLDRSSARLVAHSSLIERNLLVGDRLTHTGYVEAVAALPDRQQQGLGRLVMTVIRDLVRSDFEMGALATGVHGFYRKLGWEDWQGPTAAHNASTVKYTPGADGAVMVLRFGVSAEFDLAQRLSAPNRRGNAW